MKPPFPYYGGKQTLAEKIVALMPTHRHYVEPYCGSLAVLMAKRPAMIETVNDQNRRLMTFWRVLRDRPGDLARVCALTPHSRAEYEDCRDGDPGTDDLEMARRVWVQLAQGRASTLRPTERTGWRYVANPAYGMSIPALLEGYVERFGPVFERVRGVSLECRAALEVIADYGAHEDVLMYVDPPYVRSSRTSAGYLHEMTDADHRDLAVALGAARAAVILSGYPSDLYDLELYPDWHRCELAALTTQGGKGAARTEVLWSNRPLGHVPALFEVAS